MQDSGSRASVVLVDFQGSGLKAYLSTGKFTKSGHEVNGDTKAEGVGISRLTANFASGRDSVDGCVSVTDREALKCALWMAKNEGVWVGPSAGGNVVGAVKTALMIKKGGGGGLGRVKVVTVLCDGGASYGSKMYDPLWRANNGFGDLDGSSDDILEDDGGYVERGGEDMFRGHIGGS